MPDIPILTLTRGLPASGKTTWARQQPAVRVNRDDLRRMLFRDVIHSRAQEEQVTTAQQAQVRALLRSGISVVVDDTNLRARYVRQWQSLASEAGASVSFKDMTDVPLSVCIARDSMREPEDQVGEEVIRSMHRRYLAGQTFPLPVPDVGPPSVVRPYIPVPGLRSAIMVDIDGTLALHGDRDPYDTSRYAEDTLNRPVAVAVADLAAAGHAVLYCSGRSEDFRRQTQQWICDNFAFPFGIDDEGLLMRSSGDSRRDDIVKLELFDKHIHGSYNILAVFDDRDRVVSAWRSIGLTVFQVADGNF